MDVRPQVGTPRSGGPPWPSRPPPRRRDQPSIRLRPATQLRVASVEILGTLDDKPLDALRPNDKVWVRAASRRFGFDPGLRRDGQPLENRQRRSRKEPPDLPPNPFVSGSMGSRCATGNPGGMEDAPKFLLCGA